MRFWYCRAGLAAVGLATLCLDPSYASAQDCRGRTGKNFHYARIVETDEIAPPFAIPGLGDPKGVSVKTPFCRARGIIKPSSDWDINFEVWLPSVGAWNGRYEGVGNGGRYARTTIRRTRRSVNPLFPVVFSLHYREKRVHRTGSLS